MTIASEDTICKNTRAKAVASGVSFCFVLKCDIWFYSNFLGKKSAYCILYCRRVFVAQLEFLNGPLPKFFWQPDVSKMIKEYMVLIYDTTFFYQCSRGLPCYQSASSCSKGLENCTRLLLIVKSYMQTNFSTFQCWKVNMKLNQGNGVCLIQDCSAVLWCSNLLNGRNSTSSGKPSHLYRPFQIWQNGTLYCWMYLLLTTYLNE